MHFAVGELAEARDVAEEALKYYDQAPRRASWVKVSSDVYRNLEVKGFALDHYLVINDYNKICKRYIYIYYIYMYHIMKA